MKALVYSGLNSKFIEEHPKPSIQQPGDAIWTMTARSLMLPSNR